MKMEKPLQGERLTLRAYEKSDLPIITAMWFDPENGKYMSDPDANGVDEVYRKALDGLEETEAGYYLVAVLNSTNEIVGTANVFPCNDGKTVDIGYCVRKDHWREGFGSELLGLLIDWARAQGASEVTAEVAKENRASCGLLAKHRFAPVRESKFKKYNMGIEFESYIYQLEM